MRTGLKYIRYRQQVMISLWEISTLFFALLKKFSVTNRKFESLKTMIFLKVKRRPPV